MKKINTYIFEKLIINKDSIVSNIDEIKNCIKELFSDTDPYEHYSDIIDKKLNDIFFNKCKESDIFYIYLNRSSDKWWIEKHENLFKNHEIFKPCTPSEFVDIWEKHFSSHNEFKTYTYGGKNQNEAPMFLINCCEDKGLNLYEGYKKEANKELIILKA